MGNEDGDHYNKYSWRGHPGLVGVCTSQYLYNRKLNSGFALSCNSTRNIETIKNLIVNFLELNKPAQQIPPDQMLDQKAIKPYLGLYQKDASRFALLGFADIFMLAKTEVKNGALYMNQMGKPVKLIQVAPLTFKRQGTNTPTLIFTRNEAGDPVMIVNGRYCKMVNPFVAYSKVIILFLALLLMLFSVTLPAAILNLLRLGTFNWHKFTVFILPMVSLIALTWAVVNFSRVNEESYLLYELRQISSISISLFTGTLLFGIFSVAEFILVIKMHTQWKSRVTAWFLLLAACSFLLITTVLLLNGWIGLRTWAM